MESEGDFGKPGFDVYATGWKHNQQYTEGKHHAYEPILGTV